MIATAVLALVVAAPPPTFVVERVITMGGQTVRVSVFRDGVAVLARERTGEAKQVLRQTLSSAELQVVTQVVEESYPEIARFAAVGQGPGTGTIELRLAPAGKEPLTVKLAVLAAPSLALARVMGALDALEARLSRDTVTREDFSAWRPAVGEWLQLEDGRVVKVFELLDAGDHLVVGVQIGDGPALQFIAEGDLRRAAVRRVSR
ncbi:MAG: hypothetical protein ACHQQS_12170 [Thermoanaerobaculales bacterium]